MAFVLPQLHVSIVYHVNDVMKLPRSMCITEWCWYIMPCHRIVSCFARCCLEDLHGMFLFLKAGTVPSVFGFPNTVFMPICSAEDTVAAVRFLVTCAFIAFPFSPTMLSKFIHSSTHSDGRQQPTDVRSTGCPRPTHKHPNLTLTNFSDCMSILDSFRNPFLPNFLSCLPSWNVDMYNKNKQV